MEKIKAWIKLLSAPGISNQKAIKASRELGEPADFLLDRAGALAELSFVPQSAIDYLQADNDPPDWLNIAGLIEKYEIRFCSILEEKYPFMLKKIADPPAFLFYRGEFDESDFLRSLGVVGTRKPSVYSRTICQKFCREFAQKGVTVISGLAFGIDAVAHNTAVVNQGRTIAVLGTGVEQVYPPANRHLAERIQQQGAIISEYIPGSKINMWNFPNRNRIISGLSQGVWVVEGGEKSGALITAEYAKTHQKPVFTLPADVNRESAKGSNRLLQQGAIPVLECSDIFRGLGINEPESGNTNVQLEQLNDLEREIYKILVMEEQEIAFDKLLILSKLSVGELSTILLSLELKGFARKSAGNRIYPVK
jgi:DNA processing protein